MPPTAEPKGQNQEHLGTFYIETPANICGTYSSSCSRDMFLSQGPRGALDWKQQGQFPEERTSGCVSVGKWELSNERRKLELFSLGKVKTNQAINHYHQQNPTRGGLNQKQSILGRTPTLILGSGVTWVTNFTSPSLHFPKHSSMVYKDNAILYHIGLTLVAMKDSFLLQGRLSAHTTMSPMPQFHKPGTFTCSLHICELKRKSDS